MENQKAQIEWREFRAVAMSNLVKQKKCEELGCSWDADHSLITRKNFDSNILTCEPGSVLENSTCQSNGVNLVFEPVIEFKKTSGTFYPSIHTANAL